jgi:pyridinium-3,5-bisthiocarboxylic acid mononucleotide nickel chelatase
LLALGATDFFFAPVHMKKGRMGQLLSVLVRAEAFDPVTEFLLEHTSSIGLRYYAVNRQELPRRLYEVETPYGPVQVKEVTRPSGRKSRKIEYTSLQHIRAATGISIAALETELYALLGSA